MMTVWRKEYVKSWLILPIFLKIKCNWLFIGLIAAVTCHPDRFKFPVCIDFCISHKSGFQRFDRLLSNLIFQEQDTTVYGGHPGHLQKAPLFLKCFKSYFLFWQNKMSRPDHPVFIPGSAACRIALLTECR